MKYVYIFILSLIALLRAASAQNVELIASKINMPEGNDILGISLYEQKDMFYTQQTVLSQSKDQRIQRLRVSSWSLKTHSIIKEKMLDLDPSYSRLSPCERVEVSSKMNKALLCSQESYLTILDPDSLETAGKMAVNNNRYIYDFVIDDMRGLLYVLTGSSDNILRLRKQSTDFLWLTSFSMIDGSQINETSLPVINEGSIRKLALIEKTGEVIVAIPTNHKGNNDKSNIYSCDTEGKLQCTHVLKMDEISQLSSIDNELLAATNIFNDRKNECLLSINMDTHTYARKYCAPATGVHYAVGVAGKKYIVAFTGISKYAWLSETIKVLENSFSVWIVGNPHASAIAKDPTNFGSGHHAMVFASKTKPLFIAYVGPSNALYIYSIIEKR